MAMIPSKDYVVAYDGIVARVVKAGPEDIGVTYNQAIQAALGHMQFLQKLKRLELERIQQAIYELTE